MNRASPMRWTAEFNAITHRSLNRQSRADRQPWTSLRFGLLSMVAYVFTSLGLQSAPISFDTSSPHFGTGLFLILIVVGIAAYAFKLSLAGRSLMRDPILEH